jgi:hypothetical protein
MAKEECPEYFFNTKHYSKYVEDLTVDLSN